MSDLQLSLIVIGAVVVGAVYLYNGLQEQRFRQRMRQAFGAAPDDVLLKAGVESVLADGRLEPQLLPTDTASGDGGHAPAPRAASSIAGCDDLLDGVAEINANEAISDRVIADLTGRLASCGKPIHVEGFDPRSGAWVDAAHGSSGCTRLRLALQLVNRAGPATSAQVSSFCDAIRRCADRLSATAVCPDIPEAVQRGQALDAFCANVDVAIGINIIAREGASLAGARIHALAEGMGFRLESDGVFHFRDEQRRTLFTLDNHEPAPFLPERVKDIVTQGVTLLLDVPRVAEGGAVLERMLHLATQMAATLDARVVDDNHSALTEAGVARIRAQVDSIHAAMAARGIPAGSSRALRLFSG